MAPFLMRSLVLAVSALHCAAAQPGQLFEVSTEAGGLCDPNVAQHSGYYSLTTGKKNYFYWSFESRNDPANDPVVMWMTGGPGCSSEVALFGENGPCTLDAAGDTTQINPFSWNQNATLVYIDQPTGTGYSYGTDMDHDEAGVSRDMYDFVQQFFQDHPQYADLPFYIVGESYAGHYVPAVTHEIFVNNKNLTDGAVRINLKGVGVGNGLTNPEIQYKYYKDMVVSTNDHKAAVGNVVHGAMEAATPACIGAIMACEKNIPATCLAATEVCNAALLIPYTLTGMNPYDMREKCQVPPLCYDFSNVATYLAKPEVMKALGVDKANKKWSDCNKAVAVAFELRGDWMHAFDTMLPEQLEGGVEVLIYAGDQDYICNWLGNQAWTRALDWAHGDDFQKAPVANWTVAGKAAGTLQQSNGLSFLRVFDAGHMVPRDQPAVAQAMLNAFISGGLH